MMNSVYIAVYQKGEYVPAGIVAYDKEAGIFGFQYLPSYDGPPLDPVNLNYKKTGQRMFKGNPASNPQLLHRVFQDFLPGQWGMSALMSEHPEIKGMTDAEKLTWFGARTVGGLASRIANSRDENPVNGYEKLSQIRRESVDFFNKKIAQIPDIREKWGICSHGGARPKAAFVDNDGNHWIAKFNVDLDGFNNARIEHAMSRLAAEAGIETPATAVVKLPDGEEIFMSARYDRGTENGQEFRHHQISMFAMMDETRVRLANEADYTDVVRILKDHSANPEQDIRKLFAQMIFNVATNNTDDHARNFAMVLTDEGYRLSPAFDLTPNIHPYPHAMSVDKLPRPSLDDACIKKLATAFGIPEFEGIAIRTRVTNAVANWRNSFARNGVSEKDIEYISRAFTFGIDKPKAPDLAQWRAGKAPSLTSKP